MLKLPKLSIERSEHAEEKLTDKTREWLEKQNHERTGIHASDLLDPRKAYWDRKHKTVLSRRAVGLFFTGKVLHAFFLSALAGKKGTDWSTDEGSTFDKELGIYYSPDYHYEKQNIPTELKTSRAKYEQSNSDLKGYLEQLCIYMAAKKARVGRLITLMLNLPGQRHEGWGTFPQYRAYEITWTAKDLNQYRKQIIETRKLLEKAIKQEKPKLLPVCREFKCGANQCSHYKLCKPEGRYGTKRFDK